MSIFNRSLKRTVESSVFNLSHTYSGSFKPGLLYPILCQKVMPGDVWQIASNPFIRSVPFVAPLMTNVFVDIRYFYCRNLLLWKNFDEFITNSNRYGSGNFPAVSEYKPIHPYISFFTDETGESSDLMDYLYGIVDPNGESYYVGGLDILPARMYNLIYNEYYYNQNYQTPAKLYNGDYNPAYEDISDYTLLAGCYKKDYFTSALPSPQRGDPVNLPADVILKQLGQNAPTQNIVDKVGDPVDPYSPDAHVANLMLYHVGDDSRLTVGLNNTLASEGSPVYLDPNGTMGVTINLTDLRKASAVQRFLERSAVNGNRYAEFMLNHFGVRTPDNSSFRPQYLGGGSQIINFSPVEQNSATDDTSPQGNLAGKGVLSGVMGMNKPYLFTEYGWIMAIMTIRPEATYVGGVNRQYWVSQDRFDGYCFPVFQNIGMQPIQARELSLSGREGAEDSYNLQDIGYQERYMEYKTWPNTVHGQAVSQSGHKNYFAVRNMIGQNGDGFGIDGNFMAVQTDVFNNNSAVDVRNSDPFDGSIRHNVIVRRPLQYRAKYGGAL